MSTVRIVATDIGNGFSKGCSSTATAIFPSVIGQAVETDFEGLAGRDGMVIQPDGLEPYFVGNLARRMSRFKSAVLDRSRIGSPFYRVLFETMLTRLCKQRAELRVVLQLPVGWYSDRQELDTLIGEHRGTINGRQYIYHVDKLLVTPDGFGALCSAMLNQRCRIKDQALAEGRVGVIDLGSRTTNLSLYDSMTFIPTASESVDTGLVKLWQAVHEDLSRRFQVDWSLHEVDEAIRRGGVQVAGKFHAIDAEPHATAMAEELRGHAQTMWGLGLKLDRILLAGGGCGVPRLVEALTSLMPHARPVAEPVMANAVGGFRFGCLEVW